MYSSENTNLFPDQSTGAEEEGVGDGLTGQTQILFTVSVVLKNILL